jgi:hypothetical protein
VSAHKSANYLFTTVGANSAMNDAVIPTMLGLKCYSSNERHFQQDALPNISYTPSTVVVRHPFVYMFFKGRPKF